MYPVQAPSAQHPHSDEFKFLAPFRNLSTDQIILIENKAQCQNVALALNNAMIFGFDTESKPTFTKGEVSTGPHLIQLATLDKAYLFQVNSETLAFLAPILNNPKQIKVGFGLKNDLHLFRKKGIEIQGNIELSKSFSHFGFNNTVGIKHAMALLYQVNFIKNKKISTSNWSKKILTPEQMNYAAADAYAALLVFVALYQQKLLSPHVINQLKHQPELQKILLEKIDI